MKNILVPLIMLILAVGTVCPLQAGQKDGVKSIELSNLTFDLAEGPDRDKVNMYCIMCHGTEYIPMQPKLSKAQWTATVTKMVKTFGAPVPQEDADRIINYLAGAYGTGK